jgi:hypothetical protein
MKRLAAASVMLLILVLVVVSSVFADDGRINRPPYHFGGDTLFCNQDTGCTLLNMNGHDIAHWPQSDIATAFALTDSTGQNTQIAGEGQGTYGPMQLWSVSPDATTGNNLICAIGFDEWGKQNNMCFQVTKDFHYEQAPLPVNVPLSVPVVPTVVPTPTAPPCDTSSPVGGVSPAFFDPCFPI